MIGNVFYGRTCSIVIGGGDVLEAKIIYLVSLTRIFNISGAITHVHVLSSTHALQIIIILFLNCQSIVATVHKQTCLFELVDATASLHLSTSNNLALGSKASSYRLVYEKLLSNRLIWLFKGKTWLATQSKVTLVTLFSWQRWRVVKIIASQTVFV